MNNMEKEKFVHLPKAGYFLEGFDEPEQEFVPNTSSLTRLVDREHKAKLALSDLNHLAFVHGSYKDLLEGKRCVVRDRIWYCDNYGYVRNFEKRVCYHLNEKKGVLLFIGITQNGNSIICLKQQNQ